ncbi:hypothetical protein HF888_15640 [Bermanella marisrubri]|uniref:Uncharacterized protein n=1 Tax=Bermanella marisrubri TaxID=207949 RepID=Q1MZH9_9GAMM|nr:hypothetical protein [Bermanella marisrubri]EAT11432.1 hypothetical protein RED65_05932 [Oceanobacter sp. RED65] [Bermanella marisrubri]QIZ85571.1 hypothetical protein HF888_15640 [Bermanella marisrubri]
MTQAVKHPLKWRLADIDGSGCDQVNIVMPDFDTPTQEASQDKEILLATDIPSPHNITMDIGWTEEDSYLFFMLLDKMLNMSEMMEHLDVSQPEVVDVLHVVAAAHFIAPLDSEVYLAEDIHTVMSELDIGDLVAIHTKDGFKSAVVAQLDSIEAVCVLLEEVNIDAEHRLEVYDTLTVNKHNILPPEFGNVMPGDEGVIH